MPKIKVTSSSTKRKEEINKGQQIQQKKQQEKRSPTIIREEERASRNIKNEEEQDQEESKMEARRQTQSSSGLRIYANRTVKVKDKNSKDKNISKSNQKNNQGLNHPKDQIERRFRPSESALGQIRKFNKVQNLMIQRAPFQRFVREITTQFVPPGSDNFRWTPQALEIIQAVSEYYLIDLFEDAYACTLHGNRVTLMQKDLRLARRIRGIIDPGNGPI